MIGKKLGHFRLEAQIGAGGMGVVYRARDENLNRDVAVKVLPQGSLSDESTRRRFRQEALTLARLSHPNIGQVFDFGSEGDFDYLAMELIQGESLIQRLERGPFEEADLLCVGQQLASALQCAHEAGIIHRDLKPANLMLTQQGGLKVLDFGLAKLLELGGSEDDTRALTEAHAVTGTLPYMAPEQLRAEPVDARTDVWAAGVVLFELATGRRPFEGEVLAKLTDAILHSKPPSSRELNPRISEGMAKLVARCLEKEPSSRFPSAAELGASLTALSRGGWKRQGRPAWPLVAACILALAAGVGAWVVPRHSKAADIRSVAVLPLENLSGDFSQDYFADGMTDVLITELSKVKALKVISRTSAMRFKGSKLSLPEIAKALDVEGVIEGSVTRSGGKVRVNAQLIRASTDEHIWAETFDRQEEDVLTLHSEIAQAITGKVKLALSSEDVARFKQRRKVKPGAYDLVLQGTYILQNGGSPRDSQRALALFEKAVALDPQSAEAHAGMASALQGLAGWGLVDYWEVHPRIEKETDAALALDPGYPLALMAKGELLWAQGNPKGRKEYNRRAVEMDPGNSMALTNYGWDLDYFDKDPRGEELIRKAVDLDPLGQVQRCTYMMHLYTSGRFDEAEAQAMKILDFDPHWFFALDFLHRIHLRKGKLAEAQVESRKAWNVAFGEAFNPPAGMAWEAYDRWLEKFLQQQTKTFVPIFLADIYARRGEKKKALDQLEAAAKANKLGVMPLNYPDWDTLRNEPRFQAIVEKQGLPVAAFCMIPAK